jgi:hypothetical protein
MVLQVFSFVALFSPNITIWVKWESWDLKPSTAILKIGMNKMNRN